MNVLIADQTLVTELLPMAEAIEVMRDALRRLDDPDTLMPLRSMVALPGGERVLGLMPSYLGGLGALGVKVIAAFPAANFGSEYDSHQGVVLVFDDERGLLRAIVDATSITAIRTAAVSGVATDLLAPPARATSRSSAPAPRPIRTWPPCAACVPCDACGCSACPPAAPRSSRGARSVSPACR